MCAGCSSGGGPSAWPSAASSFMTKNVVSPCHSEMRRSIAWPTPATSTRVTSTPAARARIGEVQRAARIDPLVARAVGDEHLDPAQMVDAIAGRQPRGQRHDGAHRRMATGAHRGPPAERMPDQIDGYAGMLALGLIERPQHVLHLRTLVVPAPIAVLQGPDGKALRRRRRGAAPGRTGSCAPRSAGAGSPDACCAPCRRAAPAQRRPVSPLGGPDRAARGLTHASISRQSLVMPSTDSAGRSLGRLAHRQTRTSASPTLERHASHRSQRRPRLRALRRSASHRTRSRARWRSRTSSSARAVRPTPRTPSRCITRACT